MVKIDLFKILDTDTVVEAMKRIDKNSYGLIYVVDQDDHLLGCASDGDIRRWIIKGGRLKAPVAKAMNTAPVCVSDDKRDDGVLIMQDAMISSVAVVNPNGQLIDVILSTYKNTIVKQSNSLENTPVIVMAGGKGTRLYPFTKVLPKPLIPIREVPILERILNRFERFGVRKFYITVNYRKEMIKSYFDGIQHEYELKYIDEKEPLGTAGGIRLIREEFINPVIVTNCDILIDADYSDILTFHLESGNDLTIVSSLKNVVIPYGVLHLRENGIIESMDEKPELNNLINTGMYIINPEYISWIPEGKPFHMTELAQLMIDKGKRVGAYPVSENSFLDMGELAEMKRMEEKISTGCIE